MQEIPWQGKKFISARDYRVGQKSRRYAELVNFKLGVLTSFNVNKPRRSYLNLWRRDDLTSATDPLSCGHVIFRQWWVAENNVKYKHRFEIQCVKPTEWN